MEDFYTLNIRLIVSNFSFIDSRNIKDSSFILDEKESHHIISVLRLREGSDLTLTDGIGNVYYGIIEIISKNTVKGKILSRGGKVETIEGLPSPRTVLIEFPSMRDALKCYNSSEYQEAMKIGKGEFNRHIQIVEGT